MRQRCRHVVYASSAAANVRRDDGTLTTVYGTFQRWGEEYAATRLVDCGMSSIALRPAIVYGLGREAGATAFVNQAIAAAVAGESHTSRRLALSGRVRRGGRRRLRLLC